MPVIAYGNGEMQTFGGARVISVRAEGIGISKAGQRTVLKFDSRDPGNRDKTGLRGTEIANANSNTSK